MSRWEAGRLSSQDQLCMDHWLLRRFSYWCCMYPTSTAGYWERSQLLSAVFPSFGRREMNQPQGILWPIWAYEYCFPPRHNNWHIPPFEDRFLPEYQAVKVLWQVCTLHGCIIYLCVRWSSEILTRLLKNHTRIRSFQRLSIQHRYFSAADLLFLGLSIWDPQIPTRPSSYLRRERAHFIHFFPPRTPQHYSCQHPS